MPFRREALGCCWLNGTLMEREALAWRQWCAFDGDVEGWARMLLLIQVIQRWGGWLWPVVSKKPFRRVLSFGLDKERSERELHAEGKCEHRQTGGLSCKSRVHVGRIGSGRQAETTWRPCLTLFSAWFHLPVLQQPQGENCADSYEHLNGGRPPGRVHWPRQRGIKLFTTTRGLFPNLRGLETRKVSVLPEMSRHSREVRIRFINWRIHQKSSFLIYNGDYNFSTSLTPLSSPCGHTPCPFLVPEVAFLISSRFGGCRKRPRSGRTLHPTWRPRCPLKPGLLLLLFGLFCTTLPLMTSTLADPPTKAVTIHRIIQWALATQVLFANISGFGPPNNLMT